MSGTVAALVVAGLLVAALAFYLVWVVLILRRLVDTLGKVQFGVGAISHRVEPLGAVIHEVNRDLGSGADAMESLAEDLGRRGPVRAS